jgi:hypothetical protein
MRILSFIAFFLLAVFLHPCSLLAQEDHAPVQPLPTPVVQSTSESAVQPPQVTPPLPQRRRRRFFGSAYAHPLTPHDLAMREAVRTLGTDRHHFVRCELLDGRVVTGGILTIGPQEFRLSQGIMGVQAIRYSSLKSAPLHDPAPAEHFLNGLKWSGVVAGCIAASPLVLVFYPLVLAGVIQD